MPQSEFDLVAAARREMIAEGFQPDFPPEVDRQVKALESQPIPAIQQGVRDLRSLLWSSIDNDTSRDLDQAEVAERVEGGIRVMVAIADVDCDVPKDSPADLHAALETTSVYTGVRTFPMLPEEFSTDLTSLNENVDRYAIVIDMVVAGDGALTSSAVYRALIRNQAQLAYNGVGPWLEGTAPAPPKVAAWPALEAQLKLQDEAAQHLLAERRKLGSLNLDREEAEAVISDGHVQSLNSRRKNRATELIECFMVASNGAMARTLKQAKVSSIQRVVRTPQRWPRIIELAARYGEKLPDQPDAGALDSFLQRRKTADAVHYADVSLAVVKLMGPGEYVLSRAGEESPGHFALAAHDYSHSTAPNRRYADTVTQRLIKAVLNNAKPPYADGELDAIARNCNLKAEAARKVERVMNKRIAAVALRHRIGEMFNAVVTGAGPKGVFVRVLGVPADGMLVHGQQGVDVGDQLQVKLLHTDPEHGYIDFGR